MIWLRNILTAGAVLSFVSGLVYFFASKEEKLKRRLLYLAGTVLLSIALMEINAVVISGTERFPQGILPKTMQAFSLDADYETIFSTVVFPEHALLETCFKWFRLVVYSLAPLLGGAVVCDILVGLSPGMQLFLKRRRRMFVFSELNPKSIALAESIVKKEASGKDAVLVFANCLSGGDEEMEALKLSAKELKAICFPGDLPHIKETDRARQCIFFLMDTQPDGSFSDYKNQVLLQSLLHAEKCMWPEKQGCHIFVFTDEGASEEDIRGAKAAFDQSRRADAGEVQIHVIRDYVQAAQTLLLYHPLFESITGERAGVPLRVLILGGGDFAKVMFKTVFWCGQLLDHPLELAFVSTEGNAGDGRGPESPEGWLKRQCPEVLESCVPESDCLRASLDGTCAAPYASLYFAQASPAEIQDRDFLTRPRQFQYGRSDAFTLSQFQYLIVMSGQDRDNIDLADAFWRAFVYMAREGTISGRRHIAVAIENEVLDESTRIRYKKLLENERDIRLFTFGGDRERFQWDRLLMRGFKETRRAGKANQTPPDTSSADATKDDFFDEWSRQARKVHLSYKVASAGCWKYATDGGRKDALDMDGPLKDKVQYCRAIREDPALSERLAWLEHRRWNAFMRTQGFRRPPRLTDMLVKLEKGGDVGTDPEALRPYACKDGAARLHPYLVESLHGYRGNPPDLLDAASDMKNYVDALLGNPKTGDIKSLDRPDGIYGPTVSCEELSRFCATLEDANPQAQRVRRILEMIREKRPDVQQYEDKREPGRYYVGALLALKTD